MSAVQPVQRVQPAHPVALPVRLPVAVHAYPWDVVDDPAAPAAAARVGASSVHLAAAYHAVRAATPRHPRHRLVEAPTAASYLPVRESAWRGRRLRPQEATSWAGPDSYTRARRSLHAAGLTTRAWLALTHVDGAGQRTPDLCVTSAFGDVLGYALCPSWPEVRDYAATLVSEVCRAVADPLVVEACGQLGVEHAGLHEKTDGADWSADDAALLSLCCCPACRAGWGRAGLDARDVEHVVQRVRAAVGTAAPTDAGDPDPAVTLRRVLGEAADVVLRRRRETALLLRAVVLQAAAAEGVADVAFHACPQDASTAPAAPVMGDAPAPAGVTFVAQAWRPGSDAVVRMMRERLGASATVAAYVTGLPPAPCDPVTLGADWQRLVDAGADQLHLYHLGLASTARLDAMAQAVAGLRPLPETSVGEGRTKEEMWSL